MKLVSFTAALLRGAVVFVALLLNVLPARAEVRASEIDEVVVTATRTPVAKDRTPAEITVLTRREIERAAGRTLADLLGRSAGLQAFANGGLGKVASVSIRGLEARHTLLLVDGVRQGSATVGTPTWELLPLEQIERIEIVRGPLSGLYGSAAVGGVVQVFTRRGVDGIAPSGGIEIGALGRRAVDASVLAGHGRMDLAATVNRVDYDGKSATNPRVPFGQFNPDDDGFKQSAGSFRLGFDLGADYRAELRALRSVGISEYDDGLGAANTRAGVRLSSVAGVFSGPLAANWNQTLTVAEARDQFDTMAATSPFASLGTIGTTQRQLDWQHSVPTPLGQALVAFDHQRQRVERPGAPFALSARTVNGLTAGLSGSAGPHQWLFNARRDRNSQYGSETTGALGYGLNVSERWQLGASYGSSFTAPSFNQLYFPNFGNPNLQPENGRHAELSARFESDRQSVRVAYFSNRIRSYISSGPSPINIPRIESNGWTLSHEFRWRDWDFLSALDRADPRNATRGSANFGKQLPRRAQSSVKFSADGTLGQARVGATFQAYGERFDNASNSDRLGGFGALDLRAEWPLSDTWRLRATLNNALDRDYETVLGYPQPGREWLLALRYAR